jgi:hypothetical protein
MSAMEGIPEVKYSPRVFPNLTNNELLGQQLNRQPNKCRTKRSTTTAALRDLFGNAKTSAVGDWPTRHPVGATVVWALILLSVCTPLAAVMYRKRTTR